MIRPRPALIRAILLAGALTAVSAGCAGPGDIRFNQDGCTIDGYPADLPRVEAREAQVQRRIAHLQPWLVAITIAIVSVAGLGYGERLVFLFSARRDARGMGQRLQSVIDRYRSHPFRYFALLGGSVGLLLAAGGLYIYCDADKRASERALGALQFCHLTLRTSDEKRALDEQRQNLSSIHDTAGAIRQLIDKLPPDEQRKASEIINHMDDAVGRERRVVSQHLERSEETAAELSTQAQSIEHGLSGLTTEVDGLKGLPGDVRALADVLGRVDGRTAASAEKLAAAHDQLAAAHDQLVTTHDQLVTTHDQLVTTHDQLVTTHDQLAATGATLVSIAHDVKVLADRPAPICPACVCEHERAAPKVAAAPSLAVSPAPKPKTADDDSP